MVHLQYYAPPPTHTHSPLKTTNKTQSKKKQNKNFITLYMDDQRVFSFCSRMYGSKNTKRKVYIAVGTNRSGSKIWAGTTGVLQLQFPSLGFLEYTLLWKTKRSKHRAATHRAECIAICTSIIYHCLWSASLIRVWLIKLFDTLYQWSSLAIILKNKAT